jgi:NADH:ubiquinone oxidoreductase subunit E
MITVTVCVGSSCHLKGAREVIGRFSELIDRHHLAQQVELKGSFCMERCGEGVNWRIDDESYTSVNEREAVEVFRKEVLAPLGVAPGDEAEEGMSG